MEIATKSSWKNLSIEDPKRIGLVLHFTGKQVEKLKQGLIPKQMEDKWFIFYENDWLYFHRSWTGFGVYKAQLIQQENGYWMKEFWAERNPEKYNNTNDDTDKENLSFLIYRGLLEMDVRKSYADKNIDSEKKKLLGWSNFGNLLFTDHGLNHSDKIRSVLFGVAVGDALGVPVEFKSRENIRRHPVTGMTGYGTYNQPPGTFSDDSSLTFCLAEALTHDFDLDRVGKNFIQWYKHNYWTARGVVFDIGMATRQAISRLAQGVQPVLAGGMDASSNGNGSLMRIAPLVFYLLDKPIGERYEITRQVSSLTHAHIRSVIACFYYLEFARGLLAEKDKFEVYQSLQQDVTNHLASLGINPAEVQLFDRLLRQNIAEVGEAKISGSGYVLHSLEASIWCLLSSSSYKEAVLKAVNLGEDTDTTAAITGGLAGLLYGMEGIPAAWINELARQHDIDDLAERLGEKMRST